MNRKSAKPTTKQPQELSTRLSQQVAQPTHKLIIASLSDAQASCGCGGWTFARTGRATKKEIRAEWWMHKRFHAERTAAADELVSGHRARLHPLP